MGLTPNQELIFRLMMYLVFVLCGVVFIDGVYFSWQRKKRLLTPLQERRRNQRLVVGSTFTFCLLLGWMAGQEYVRGRGNWLPFLPAVIAPPVMIANLYRVFRSPRSQDFEKNFSLNPRHCGRCDYDLTGNVSGVCPECGWVIPQTPPSVEDPNWWRWWRKWRIDLLERWRLKMALNVLLLTVQSTMSAFLVYLLLGATDYRPFSNPPFGRMLLVILPLFAIVLMVCMAIHFGVTVLRIAAYGWRNGRSARG